MLTARDRIPAHIALFAFVTLLLVVGANHEPWFDEAQAWLIARDNSPWSLVSHGVRYEGTPALWHGMLWGLQRMGFPYRGLWLVSSGLAVVGAGLVLYRSPFPIALKIGLIFTYFFAYQYSVVARSYALDVALLPVLAWRFPARTSQPLIYAGLLGLLANTNAHSFVLSAIMGLEQLWRLRFRLGARDPQAFAAIGLLGVLAFAAILQAWPPADINFLTKRAGDNPALRGLLFLTEGVIERGDIFSPLPPPLPWRIVGVILTFMVLAPAALLWRQAKHLALALGMFGGLIGFSALKYGNNWHAGIILLTFVFCLWISWSCRHALPRWARRWLYGALGMLVVVQIWFAAAADINGLDTAYSAAPAAAKALAEHRLAYPNETIAVFGFKGFAVAPFFPSNVFANYEGGAPKPAYYLWRRAETPIPGVSEDTWRQTLKGNYDRILLSSFNLMGWNGPARFIADAHRAGYCATDLYRGAMVWKTYVMETDDMMIFDRCSSVMLKFFKTSHAR